MENVIDKKAFWRIVYVVSACVFVLHFMAGLPFLGILLGNGWFLLLCIHCRIRDLSSKEHRVCNRKGVAVVNNYSIQLSETAIDFDNLVAQGRPYLMMAKFKKPILCFLILASLFYALSFMIDISFILFPHTLIKSSANVKTVSLLTIATIFTGISFGFIMLILWLAGKFPRIRYEKASFYALPAEEKERKEIRIAENTESVEEARLIIEQKEGFLLVPKGFLVILPQPKSGVSDGVLMPGKVLCLGEKPVLAKQELTLRTRVLEKFSEEPKILY